MTRAFWLSFQRSLLRGGIALGVFLLVGIAELAFNPSVVAGSPLPWPLVAVAIMGTLVAWKAALRWSFFPEDEPREIHEIASVNQQVLSYTADLAAVQVPALAYVAVVICCAAPTPKLRVEDRLIVRSQSSAETYRVEL